LGGWDNFVWGLKQGPLDHFTDFQETSPVPSNVDAHSAAASAGRMITSGLLGAAESRAGRPGMRIGRAHTCCFVAGTLVVTAGGLRPIEKIKVGDLVLSRSDASGESAYKAVTSLIQRHHRLVWRLSVARTPLNNQGDSEVFETTDDHPWRSEDGRWVATAELHPSMRIVTADGEPVTVVSIAATRRTAVTFNLEVADYHSYFVGKSHVWVHNACPTFGRGQQTTSRGECSLEPQCECRPVRAWEKVPERFNSARGLFHFRELEVTPPIFTLFLGRDPRRNFPLVSPFGAG
jgi:hypothetical protein